MTEVKKLVWADLKRVRARLNEPEAGSGSKPEQHTLFE
jgi:hypothetical protein